MHLSYILILLIHPNTFVETTQTQVFTMDKFVASSVINSIITSIHHPPIHPFAVTNYRALKYTMGKRHQQKIKFLTSFNDFPSPNYSCILNMPMSWEEGWHLLMHARGSRDIKCVTNAMVLFK